MNAFETWSLIIAGAAVLVNIVLFVVVVQQLGTVKEQIQLTERIAEEAENRARRQATVDFYAATHSRRMEFLRLFNEHGMTSPQEVCNAAMEDSKVRNQLIDYLNYYEFLAVGVHTATYDFETIRRLASGRIRKISEDYRPYIEWARSRPKGSPRLFAELEELAEELRAKLATPA